VPGGDSDPSGDREKMAVDAGKKEREKAAKGLLLKEKQGLV